MSKPPSGTHETLQREEVVEGSSDRAFGFTFAVVFTIIGMWPVVWWWTMPIWWALGVAGVFLALALACPAVLAPLNKLWLRFGLLLHAVITPVVMGLIFFVAVTPTGLIMRALGKDMLRLKRDDKATSYWIHRTPPGPEPGSIRNQF